MGITKIFNGTFKDMLGVGMTEEEERQLEDVVDDVVVDDINDVGKGQVEELKTEFVSRKKQNAEVAAPIGLADEKVSETEFGEPGINENQTIFVEPKNYSECKKIANYIKEDKIVTVNLEYVDGGTAQRIIDFLSGALSIKGANFITVSKRVYVAVPKNMEIVFDGKSDATRGRSIQIED